VKTTDSGVHVIRNWKLTLTKVNNVIKLKSECHITSKRPQRSLFMSNSLF